MTAQRQISKPFSRSLACGNCSAENVIVPAVVVTELELSDVQRKILFADLVERSHDAALHERPKTFDGVRVNGTVNIFALTMTHDPVRIHEAKMTISIVLIACYEANPIRHSFANKSVESYGVSVCDHASDYITLALDCANDNVFARAACSTEVAAPTFAFVFVFAFPPT